MEERPKLIKRLMPIPEKPIDNARRMRQVKKRMEKSYKESHEKGEFHPTVPDPPIYVFNNFKNSIERRIKAEIEKALKAEEIEGGQSGIEEDEYDEHDEYIKERITYKTQTRVVNKILEELNFLVKHVKRLKKKTWEPPMWMVRDKKIWENLQRSKFLEVYPWLRNNLLYRRDKKTWEILDKAGGNCWHGDFPNKPGATEHIVCMPDFGKMKLDLHMGEKVLALYLKKFSEIGIIWPLPKGIGKGGKNVYALGERRGYPGRDRDKGGMASRWYLKETPEIKKGLRELRIRKEK